MFDGDDELQLNPETEEDLDVGAAEGENVAGGAGTLSMPSGITPKLDVGGPTLGSPRPMPRPGFGDPNRMSTGDTSCDDQTKTQGCTATTNTTCCT